MPYCRDKFTESLARVRTHGPAKKCILFANHCQHFSLASYRWQFVAGGLSVLILDSGQPTRDIIGRHGGCAGPSEDITTSTSNVWQIHF
eukprot:1885002-Amphidinium_carterae.1